MTEETKRASISEITYVTKSGEVHKQVSPDAVIVRTKFSDGFTDDVTIADLAKDIRACAVLQGLSIKLQRSFASAKGDVAAAIESYQTVKENLMAGIWASKREGSGPRLSILVEAVVAFLLAEGQEVSDERKAAISEKLKDETVREATMADAKVKAHYERIKAERAAERASKAASEAATATSSAASLF